MCDGEVGMSSTICHYMNYCTLSAVIHHTLQSAVHDVFPTVVCIIESDQVADDVTLNIESENCSTFCLGGRQGPNASISSLSFITALL